MMLMYIGYWLHINVQFQYEKIVTSISFNIEYISGNFDSIYFILFVIIEAVDLFKSKYKQITPSMRRNPVLLLY